MQIKSPNLIGLECLYIVNKFSKGFCDVERSHPGQSGYADFEFAICVLVK